MTVCNHVNGCFEHDLDGKNLKYNKKEWTSYVKENRSRFIPSLSFVYIYLLVDVKRVSEVSVVFKDIFLLR